jgi:hypothetical protein
MNVKTMSTIHIFVAILFVSLICISVDGRRSQSRKKSVTVARTNYIKTTTASNQNQLGVPISHGDINREFCTDLEPLLKKRLLPEDLTTIAELYMEKVYTSEHFPYTWRDATAQDHVLNTTHLYLGLGKVLTAQDVRQYYGRHCRSPVVPKKEQTWIDIIGPMMISALFMAPFLACHP